ncbi:DUF2188 domain-containing protein [Rhizobium daejeonense]
MTTVPNHLTYHVGRHDGGWAYHLDNVWSEPFPTHADAHAAAHQAARRQQRSGQSAEIVYQAEDGTWHREFAGPSDRPDVSVAER